MLKFDFEVGDNNGILLGGLVELGTSALAMRHVLVGVSPVIMLPEKLKNRFNIDNEYYQN